MQVKTDTGSKGIHNVQAARMTKRRNCSSSFYAVGLLLTIVGSTLFLDSSALISRRSPGLPDDLGTAETVATNGADLWIRDTIITHPGFDFSATSSGAQRASVSHLFGQYYASHHGVLNLGRAITVAFPTIWGWIQFFESDALLLPGSRPVRAGKKDDPLASLIASSVRDPDSGIVHLPLLRALLTAGSQVSPVEGTSSLTYVALRRATDPNLMLTAPGANATAASSPRVGVQEVFMDEGNRADKPVGHLIPATIWAYMHSPDIAPDGWKTDFGPPLTEALPFLGAGHNGIHHMLLQLFWQGGIVLDQDASPTLDQPRIWRLKTSLAYLRTIGPPPLAVAAQQSVWSQAESTLLDAPDARRVLAHVGQHFPLVLLGDATWSKGVLWYHVQWNAARHLGDGWMEASRLTFDSPGTLAGWASFDVLSPALVAYLARFGGNVGSVVYDVTRQRAYAYNASAKFIMGSSMKVPIMLTFLAMTEREGREPDGNEMDLLTTMIENSNNDSASALYYGEIGGASGIASYLESIGVTDLIPAPNAWGYSVITPKSMVRLLTLLYDGQILTARDRSLAFSLMEHIEPDQQVGVGDSAPQGAVVAMKDGWLPGPDGLWAMNTSGIVTAGKETYIVSVYTQEQNALQDGQAIARHVCGEVASLLL